MDRVTFLWIAALNIVALAVLYQRLSRTGQVPTLPEILDGSFLTSRKCGWENSTRYIITSTRVVLESGVQPAAVYIKNGKIEKINTTVDEEYGPVVDYKDAVVFPGVIDVHAHMNEPGREDWEGMTTATSAAAAGGITTVVDMPLNSDPVTINKHELTRKMHIAKHKAHVNVGFWGGLVPANAHNKTILGQMLGAGALGFKSFMCHSGINDFPDIGRDDLAAALPFLRLRGVPFFVHAELVHSVESPPEADPRAHSTWLNSRPVTFERNAITQLKELMEGMSGGPQARYEKCGWRVHIAHLSDAGSLPIIKEVKDKGYKVSVETCAHYLNFVAERVPDGETKFKCAPPIRDADNQNRLIEAILAGDITIVSSDHSPAPPSMKQLETGNFMKAWGGISGIQYLLPATWTPLSARGANLTLLARLLSENPAKMSGMWTEKGSITPGKDADLTIWSPETEADTGAAGNRHKHKITPYQDLQLKGRVLATIVRGHVVFEDRKGVHKSVCGRVVKRRNHPTDTGGNELPCFDF